MTPGFRSALAWSAVALMAAALNLSVGTACATCCRARPSRPKAEWRRPLVGPIYESEPNDDERGANSLVEARDETRTRFEGSCAGGTRDVFHISTVQGKAGVVAELRSRHGPPPPARLRAPKEGVTAEIRNGRIELFLPRDHYGASVYLEIDCPADASRSTEYHGWITAMRPHS